MGHSRGGLTTKIHAVVDAEGRPFRFTDALIRLKVLPSVVAPNPITHIRQRVVPIASLEEFNRRYISLYALSKERNLKNSVAKREIEATGVRPAFDPAQVHATFYEREEVHRVLNR